MMNLTRENAAFALEILPGAIDETLMKIHGARRAYNSERVTMLAERLAQLRGWLAEAQDLVVEA